MGIPANEIVVYCADVYCAASIYAYRLLEHEGFSRLRRFAGGIVEWEEAGYPLEGGLVEPAPERPQIVARGRRNLAPSRPVRPSWNRPWHVYA